MAKKSRLRRRLKTAQCKLRSPKPPSEAPRSEEHTSELQSRFPTRRSSDLERRTPLSSCALISASPAGTTLVVELACTDKEAVEGRQLQVLTEDGKKIAAQTEAQDGAVQIEIPQAPERGSDPIDLSAWSVQLTRPQNEELDQIPEE